MIISASRRTDIPSFYSEWFINRLRENFVYVKNPFNAKQISKIILTPEQIDCIVFWTKNPKKLLVYLPEIERMGYKYYFQFTLTSYDSSIERGVPKKSIIIETFKRLSEKIGNENIIWRYDPIFITDKYDITYHLKWYEYLAERLNGYTKKCIFSFIHMYQKCQKNLKKIQLNELSHNNKKYLVKNIYDIAEYHSMKLESCAQEESFEKYGVCHSKCIDDSFISNIIGRELDIKKDRNQREQCGCVSSVDIGTYNTCKNFCRYCYANYNEKSVLENIESHNAKSPIITGLPIGEERITERKNVHKKAVQLSLFNKNIA